MDSGDINNDCFASSSSVTPAKQLSREEFHDSLRFYYRLTSRIQKLLPIELCTIILRLLFADVFHNYSNGWQFYEYDIYFNQIRLGGQGKSGPVFPVIELQLTEEQPGNWGVMELRDACQRFFCTHWIEGLGDFKQSVLQNWGFESATVQPNFLHAWEEIKKKYIFCSIYECGLRNDQSQIQRTLHIWERGQEIIYMVNIFPFRKSTWLKKWPSRSGSFCDSDEYSVEFVTWLSEIRKLYEILEAHGIHLKLHVLFHRPWHNFDLLRHGFRQLRSKTQGSTKLTIGKIFIRPAMTEFYNHWPDPATASIAKGRSWFLSRMLLSIFDHEVQEDVPEQVIAVLARQYCVGHNSDQPITNSSHFWLRYQGLI